jgi:hypothetical protein
MEGRRREGRRREE